MKSNLRVKLFSVIHASNKVQDYANSTNIRVYETQHTAIIVIIIRCYNRISCKITYK